MEAPSLPYDSFWTSNITAAASEITTLCRTENLKTKKTNTQNLEKSQHTFHQRNQAEQKPNSKKTTSQQTIKPIRILQSQRDSNQEARSCQRGQRPGRSLEFYRISIFAARLSMASCGTILVGRLWRDCQWTHMARFFLATCGTIIIGCSWLDCYWPNCGTLAIGNLRRDLYWPIVTRLP